LLLSFKKEDSFFFFEKKKQKTFIPAPDQLASPISTAVLQ
jgi:hypothetical protein